VARPARGPAAAATIFPADVAPAPAATMHGHALEPLSGSLLAQFFLQGDLPEERFKGNLIVWFDRRGFGGIDETFRAPLNSCVENEWGPATVRAAALVASEFQGQPRRYGWAAEGSSGAGCWNAWSNILRRVPPVWETAFKVIRMWRWRFR